MTSACSLPCAREGADCVLLGRRALLLARRAEAAERIEAALGLLGLQLVHALSDGAGTVVLPPYVDLVVCADFADLRAAADLVGLLHEERPWVPLLVATPGGQAVLATLEGGAAGTPLATGDFATMVVRAACRMARHSRVPARVPERIEAAATRVPPPIG